MKDKEKKEKSGGATQRLVVKPKSFKAKKEKSAEDKVADRAKKTKKEAKGGEALQGDEKHSEEETKMEEKLSSDTGAAAAAAEEEKKKKDKKDKKEGNKPSDSASATAAAQIPTKKRKAEHEGQEEQSSSSNAAPKQQQQQQRPNKKAKTTEVENAGAGNGEQGQQGVKKRYLVFAGNLPYDATEAELRDHFKGIGSLAAVRLRDQKGFAFLEFEDPATHAKALKLNHSMLRGRRINVEMTAGGGGNSANRKKKITEKNKKFQDEWAKKIAAEKEAQEARAASGESGENAQGGDDF